MSNDALEVLPPIPTTLEIGGEQIDVSPLRVGDIPKFLRAIRPFVGKIGAEPDWIALLAEYGESVIGALAIACRRPPEWVSGLALDDAIRLAEAVFGVNADFFIRRVVPEITRVSQRIGTVIPGATPSPGSSATATATQTS